MAPLKILFFALTASVATAFAPASFTKAPASTTQLQETFGLGLGEDTYENQPDLLKGEQEYKQYVNKISEENMLNRKVCEIPGKFLEVVAFFVVGMQLNSRRQQGDEIFVSCVFSPILIISLSRNSTMSFAEFVSWIFFKLPLMPVFCPSWKRTVLTWPL